jgi:2-polyprenyl-3-methyl-5-hydroxy-6-metoxy-1,4-benzoquinol methylase
MTFIDRFLQHRRMAKALAWIQEGTTLLDAGCHQGELLMAAGRKITRGLGIDPLTESQHLTPNVELRKGFFPDAMMPGERFDNIAALAVLEHIKPNDQPAFFEACHTHLNPGGRLILTVPSPAVDRIIALLVKCKLAEGMSLEEHYGYRIQNTVPLAKTAGFHLLKHTRFQLGLNNLFVFQKP